MKENNNLYRVVVTIVFFIVLGLVLPASTTSAQDRSTNIIVGLSGAYDDPDAARESGAGWELVQFRWDLIQPTGPSDWVTDGPTGEWVTTAREQGREVVGVLVGTPEWATEGQPYSGVPSGLNLPVNEPENLWAAFVKQVVNYYAARGVNHWVIWEYVDAPAGSANYSWDSTPETYYQLVKVAYQAAKGVNPSAEIHLSGFGVYDPTWLNRYLDIVVSDPTAPANDYYFDVATVHVYYSPEDVHTRSLNPFYLMNAKGMPLKRVWVNQTNARPAVDSQVYGDDASFSKYRSITLEQQAAFIIQSYALGLAAGVERIGVYRLVDDLEADNGQAWGLVRTDGTPRPAYTAFQIVAREFDNPIYKRRVDEETFPLIDYVRLTFATKVTHVIWTTTSQNATLVIPARSSQADLIDMYDNWWTITPENGEYRIAVKGATCNEPTAPSGCMIGGMPWILVERDVVDPVNSEAPSVRVEEGGQPLEPVPGQELTATAQAQPTATPTEPPPTDTPTAEPTNTVQPTPEPTIIQATDIPTEPSPTEPSATAATEPSPSRRPPGAPKGIMAVLPYLMIVLGVAVVGSGITYYFETWPFTILRAGTAYPMDEIYEDPSDEQEEWEDDEYQDDNYQGDDYQDWENGDPPDAHDDENWEDETFLNE